MDRYNRACIDLRAFVPIVSISFCDLSIVYSKIRKYVHISMNNNLYTIALVRCRISALAGFLNLRAGEVPNLANVQVIVDFTIRMCRKCDILRTFL